METSLLVVALIMGLPIIIMGILGFIILVVIFCHYRFNVHCRNKECGCFCQKIFENARRGTE